MFDSYLRDWTLTQDGKPIETRSSRLLPVLHLGCPAMLKIAIGEEEKNGGAVMAWWGGHGAACVLAHDAEAVLLERAPGAKSLVDLATSGLDEDAAQIICDVVARLHEPRSIPRPALVPLAVWFGELEAAATSQGGIFIPALAAASELLAEPRGNTVLHGDIHHANILDFGPGGWLAIDPKGLQGEAGFDYANLFRNPTADVALQPGRFAKRVEIVAAHAGLETTRLLKWVLAVMGLSAAWHITDDELPATTIATANMAAAALGGS